MLTPSAKIISKFWKFCDQIGTNPTNENSYYMLPFKEAVKKFKLYSRDQIIAKRLVKRLEILPNDIIFQIYKIDNERKYRKVLNELIDINTTGNKFQSLSQKITSIKRKQSCISLLWMNNHHVRQLDVKV